MANAFPYSTVVLPPLAQAYGKSGIITTREHWRYTNNFTHFESADKFSAVIATPCCTTDTTGVIESPNASTKHAL